jgi:hypothetical protein
MPHVRDEDSGVIRVHESKTHCVMDAQTHVYTCKEAGGKASCVTYIQAKQ